MKTLNWGISNWVWSPLPWAVCRSGGSAAIDLVLQQTEKISEEWSREDLGNKIQVVVADALTKSGAIQAGEVTR